MKHFIDVFVSSNSYHGSSLLTYHVEENIKAGQVVRVPLQRKIVLGVVRSVYDSSDVITKPIAGKLDDTILPKQSLELLEWIRTYYPAALGTITSLFVPKFIDSTAKPIENATQNTYTKPDLPRLTPGQEKIVQALDGRTGSVLLHGNTGTGKTRVYVELAKKALKHKKSVLLLTPEIGLTPQLATDVSTSLGMEVSIIHSKLTPKGRRKIFDKVMNSKDKPVVVVGPRSALFLPFQNLGLIVQDEFHDSAYKQEQAPYYLTQRIAATLAQFHDALVVYGSATPSVTDYYYFTQKQLPIYRLTEIASKQNEEPAEIKIVNYKNREDFSKNAWLSDTLIQELRKSLAHKQQSLLFVNRRGTARTVLCQTCGWQLLCPKCDLPLTYHGDKHVARCHTCGYSDNVPVSCPDCASSDLIFKGIGTKAVVDLLEALLPGARIMRFDADNSKTDSFEQNYQMVKNSGEIDIIVGTQLISKGLDLPSLRLVGVLFADSSLSFPDFSVEERTYQQLTQIIGRVGRGHLPGTVILQTYQPEHRAITFAVQNDFDGFYAQEIEEREKYGFPPFYFMLTVWCERATPTSARNSMQKFVEAKLKNRAGLQILGPSPKFIEKMNDKYRWQVVIKSKNRSQLLEIIKEIHGNFHYDIDPQNLL